MDFSYGNKVINASGPIKPSDRNMPGDPRTRVEVFADIANIPTPYVGMTITVLQDETNDNKMTEYKVKSLKANSFGVANSLVDEVVRYVDYLGATSGGGSSSGGASVEIVNDLTTGGANKALSAEQGKVIKSSLDEITQTVGDEASGLVKDVNDLKNASGNGSVDLDGYYTKAEIDAYRPLVKNVANNVWTLQTLNQTDTYKTIITHNLNTKNIYVAFYDSDNEFLYCSYKCIDDNNIEVTNDEAIKMTAIFFHSGVNTTQSSGSSGISYANQTWTFIGDSITAGIGTTKTYIEYLREKLSLGVVRNLGLNGKSLSPTMANDIASADTNTNLVMVFGGTNDFYGNKALGEYYTVDGNGNRTLNTDKNTFRGALISICSTMLTKFPTSKHILLTPIHRELYLGGQLTSFQKNTLGLYLEDYVQSIIEVGKLMSIKVIDLYSLSGLQPNIAKNKELYFSSNDGLHPIAMGHEKIANCIIENL